jgi:alanine racemase
MFPETRMDDNHRNHSIWLWPSPEVFVNFWVQKSDPLQRVISRKNHECEKMQKLESLSDMELVSLQKERWKWPAIHWLFHGYSRSLSNQGRVLINGQQCIVVGSVNMEQWLTCYQSWIKERRWSEVLALKNEISNINFSDCNQLTIMN